MKRLLPRSSKSMKRTVGLFSPVCRLRLTLVFSSSRLKTCRLFSNSPVPGKLAVSRLTTSSTWSFSSQGLMTCSRSRSTGSITTSVNFSRWLAEGILLLVEVEVEDLPAEPGKLVQERFLDVVALVQAMRLGEHELWSLGSIYRRTPEARRGARAGPACSEVSRRIDMRVNELP